MTERDELFERCKAAATGRFNYSLDASIESVLAEVFRTLETVTPEMVRAWDNPTDEPSDFPTSFECAQSIWTDMLRASPLAPPKEQSK